MSQFFTAFKSLAKARLREQISDLEDDLKTEAEPLGELKHHIEYLEEHRKLMVDVKSTSRLAILLNVLRKAGWCGPDIFSMMIKAEEPTLTDALMEKIDFYEWER